MSTASAGAPRIVVTVAVADRQTDPANAAAKNALYAASVTRHGGEAIVLDATSDEATRTAAFATMDGLLISGGAVVTGEARPDADVTVQYRVAFSKKDEAIEGPDDADLVVTIAAADAAMEPTVAYMRGKLKSTGPTGPLLALLRDGGAAAVISRLASRP
jgi:hypothetical protein